ncbi:hypothetical protein PVK06_042728 [Gossypium arboreum]|uniref:Uncharacterized protein n=1 Tax=Gossypium arboreum TaxID=29729 RepID=A0ABR0MLX8_GOSAR|nr:hypothetical protein PVK06_042728 [Gossypium arboreum]
MFIVDLMWFAILDCSFIMVNSKVETSSNSETKPCNLDGVQKVIGNVSFSCVSLKGLTTEYELVRVVASATTISLDLLTEMLVDCETRQMDFISTMPTKANLVQQ